MPKKVKHYCCMLNVAVCHPFCDHFINPALPTVWGGVFSHGAEGFFESWHEHGYFENQRNEDFSALFEKKIENLLCTAPCKTLRRLTCFQSKGHLLLVKYLGAHINDGNLYSTWTMSSDSNTALFKWVNRKVSITGLQDSIPAFVWFLLRSHNYCLFLLNKCTHFAGSVY